MTLLNLSESHHNDITMYHYKCEECGLVFSSNKKGKQKHKCKKIIMNKKQFSDLVDNAIRDCQKFRKIDTKFMLTADGLYDINQQIEQFNKLKQDAQDHFKTCKNQYCKQIHDHNMRKRND